jgi:hypothetical protein
MIFAKQEMEQERERKDKQKLQEQEAQAKQQLQELQDQRTTLAEEAALVEQIQVRERARRYTPAPQ